MIYSLLLNTFQNQKLNPMIIVVISQPNIDNFIPTSFKRISSGVSDK